ncbi:MAG: PCYCGC motif-containing (lipo)protein [Thermoleophilia bacterium]|nr:PCYCGC motif-containing (lipo)protein [Thermoleophilia bacterium]
MFDENISGSPGFSSFFTIICVLLLMTLALGGFAVFTSLSNAAMQDPVFQLPDFVSDPGAVRGSELAYQAAAEMPELFSRIPCFCGCSLTGKHHSNLDCFVESWSADKIVFTSHGST